MCYKIGASDTNNKNTSNSEKIDENETNGTTIDQSVKDETGIVLDMI